MTDSVPAGFLPIDLGVGWAAGFGQVYVNRAAHAIGFRVGANHVNPDGVCRGGAMATIADMQIAGVIEHGPGTSDNHSPTITLQLDMIANAPLGAWVEATVTLVKKTRTMLFTQAVISADGSPVARSNAIYRTYEGGTPKRTA